jgi:hypothetical protein
VKAVIRYPQHFSAQERAAAPLTKPGITEECMASTNGITTRTNQQKPRRCWDELERFGTELADNPYRLTSSSIAEVAQYFEVPKLPEEKAVHALLEGLTAAVETINKEKDDDEKDSTDE